MDDCFLDNCHNPVSDNGESLSDFMAHLKRKQHITSLTKGEND